MKPTVVEAWRGFVPYCPQLVDAHRRVAAFVNGTGPGALVLSGGYGSGKTHLAYVAYEWLQPDCVMISEPDWIAQIQASYGGHGDNESQIVGRMRRAGVLIIDDVGTAHVKGVSQPWLESLYWRIFDRRYEEKRRTLITTNRDLNGVGARIGPRAMSRLMGMMDSREAGLIDLSDVADWRLREWRK